MFYEFIKIYAPELLYHEGVLSFHYARSIYSQVLVSILIFSPSLINIGTFIWAPVSTVAFLRAFVEVFPFTAGSVSVTKRSINKGGSNRKNVSLVRKNFANNVFFHEFEIVRKYILA